VNCDLVHRRLLGLERPESPPADLREHLAGCPACRSWHEHLVALEREVPFLPVPAPERRTAFLRQLGDKAPVIARPRLFRPSLNSKRERGQRKVAIAVALAASLLILALGAWLWQPPLDNAMRQTVDGAVKSPLQHRLEITVTWQEAKTARERVVVLDKLAETVKAEALTQGTSTEEVRKKVRLYQEVIDRLTTQEAPLLLTELKETDRKELLQGIAGRLRAVRSEAEQLALERKDLAGTLRELAFVAAEGERKLQPLCV